MVITTCQICARPIKANTGLIAHHGYKRPGQGWQTSSCRGARHLPYEESCDLIPVAIEEINEYVERQQERLTELTLNPPAELRCSRYRGARNAPEVITVEKPENFNPDHKDYRPYSYSTIYHDQRYDLAKKIGYALHDKAFLEKRLANWKPKGE